MTIPMFQKKSHTHVEKGRSQLSAWQLQEGGESDACWHLFGSLELKKCTDLGLALGAYKNSSICISSSSKSRPISSGFQRNTSVEAVYKQSETVWRMAHDFETRKLGALDQKNATEACKYHSAGPCISVCNVHVPIGQFVWTKRASSSSVTDDCRMKREFWISYTLRFVVDGSSPAPLGGNRRPHRPVAVDHHVLPLVAQAVSLWFFFSFRQQGHACMMDSDKSKLME